MRAPLAALLLGACGAPPAEPLRIAVNPWPGYESLFLAETIGAYARAGVRVRLVGVSSTGDARRSFEREQVDGFAGTLVELLVASRTAARVPQAVFVHDVSAGADVVLARQPIASVRALKGRRVAVEPGALDVLILARALEREGLRLADVHLVPVPQAALATRFRAGTIDAAASYPPTSTAIVREGLARPIFDSSRIPGDIVDILAFDSLVVARRTDEVARVLRAVREALDFMRAFPDSAARLGGAREGMRAEEFTAALRGIRLASFEEQAALLASPGGLAATLRETDRILREAGAWTSPTPGHVRTSAAPLARAMGAGEP